MTYLSDPKNILITGASSGIGEALALYYAREGRFLAISGRNEERLELTAEACRSLGAEVEACCIDVGVEDDMVEWVRKIDDYRPFDLVVANAGISGGTGGLNGAEPLRQAEKIFSVNVFGVLHTIHPALDRMCTRGSGQVGVVSSLASFRGFPGSPAYCASKAAVRVYGESLRGAMAGCGVHVSVICPGFVKSRMTDVNGFEMPFLIDANKAAKKIAEGLKKDRGRISFTLPSVFTVWLLATLPDFISGFLTRKTPAKPLLE